MGIGAPMDLPPDLPLIVQVGGGETQVKGLERVTRSGDGTVHRDVLFYAGTHTYPNGDGTYRQVDDYHANGVTIPTPVPGAQLGLDAATMANISGYGVSANGAALVVSLCVKGQCGGLGATNDAAEAVLYRSLDGGITWSEMARVSGGAVSVRVVTSDGRAIVGLTPPTQKNENLFWEPADTPIIPPAEAPVGDIPELLPDGRLVWPGLDAWYFDDGTVAAHRPASQPGGFFSNAFPFYTDAQTGNFLAAYSTPPGVEDIAIDLGKGIYLGTIGAGLVPGAGPDAPAEIPAWIDATTGVIRPITNPFLQPDGDLDFLYLAGAYPQATYDRVTGVSSCLNLHASPDASSPVLGCLANDVLVVDLLTSDKLVADTPISGWRDVLTLDGIHAYADARYLTLE